MHFFTLKRLTQEKTLKSGHFQLPDNFNYEVKNTPRPNYNVKLSQVLGVSTKYFAD